MTEPELKRKQIRSLRELQRGDHVAWHRDWGHWHHALTKEVNLETEELFVIEYAKQGGKVTVHESRYGKHECFKDPFYRFHYAATELDGKDPLERAEQKMNEKRYNPFSNNCEHFVRWCKTGKKASEQVKNAAKRVGQATAILATHVVRSAVKESVKMAAKSSAKVASKALSGIGIGIGVVVDAGFCTYEVVKAKKALDNKNIDRREFKGIRAQEISKAATSSGIAATFFSIGLAIPLPFTGVIFGVIGSVAGALLSVPIGKKIGDIARKWVIEDQYVKTMCMYVKYCLNSETLGLEHD